MKLNFQWDVEASVYIQSESLTINDILVGRCEWNGSISRDETEEYKQAHRYVGQVFLPARIGRAYQSLYAPTMEECQKKVEAVVLRWFDKALAEEKVN